MIRRAMYDAWAQEQTSGAASAVTDGPAADPIADLCARLRALHIIDEVGSNNPLGRDAAAALERLRAERDDWKRLAENWTACADAAQQPPEFYEKYNEGTMRAMQALLTRERTEGAALRTERDALRECVKAADAIRELYVDFRRSMLGRLENGGEVNAYDAARAKVTLP